MHEELPRIRCPACHSALVAPVGEKGLWECRYHLCRAVFAVYPRGTRDQVPLVNEEGTLYRPKKR